jgi:hypothetical protein
MGLSELSAAVVYTTEVLVTILQDYPGTQTASKSSLHQCGNKLTVFPHLIPPDSNRIGIEK